MDLNILTTWRDLGIYVRAERGFKVFHRLAEMSVVSKKSRLTCLLVLLLTMSMETCSLMDHRAGLEFAKSPSNNKKESAALTNKKQTGNFPVTR
jgi:hypothetical protein